MNEATPTPIESVEPVAERLGQRAAYKLRARFPIKAKTPKSVAYEYYTPSSRGVQQPETITVTE